MLTIATTCARCNERAVLMYVFVEGGMRPDGTYETAFRCAHCTRLSVITMHSTANVILGNMDGDMSIHRHLSVRAVYPELKPITIPEHLPGPVAQQLTDGLEILRQKKWTAAAGCFRNVLDRATKLLWRSHQQSDDWPKELSVRIQALRAKLQLPEAVADWAHQVRIVGNDIHDIEEVTDDDAQDAAHFTETFLTYTYTLPKRLEILRARREFG